MRLPSSFPNQSNRVRLCLSLAHSDVPLLADLANRCRFSKWFKAKTLEKIKANATFAVEILYIF